MAKNNFFEDVYQVVCLIPHGRVTSYGAIANYLGSKMSARMVGWALNAAHMRPEVPAHRVVNRNGVLTGKHHFGSPTAMEEALAAEGIQVADNRVVSFKQLFWDPQKELI